MNVILEGVVGSTAYGLAREGSDIDKQGVYLADTSQFLGIHPLSDKGSTKDHSDPDFTYHELGKFCRLVLGGNPTVTDVLWLDRYSDITPLGIDLVLLRRSFLSAPRVRGAYFGYASDQFRRIQRRESNDFSSDTAQRTRKHGIHIKRLMAQGFQLWSTGRLSLKVDNPQEYFDFGDEVQAGNLDVCRALVAEYEDKFNSTPPLLPEKPETWLIDQWLVNARQENMR